MDIKIGELVVFNTGHRVFPESCDQDTSVLFLTYIDWIMGNVVPIGFKKIYHKYHYIGL